MPSEIVIPNIHQNGTSQDELTNQVCEVYSALVAAESAIRKAAPNGRDYYLNAGEFDRAIEQHRRRRAAVQELMEEYQEIMIGISSQ